MQKKKIRSLSTGGAHSQLLGCIATPTSPRYTTHSSVPHKATVEMSCLRHWITLMVNMCILVKWPSPAWCTPSTWPLSPTNPCRRHVLRSVFTVTVVSKAVMYIQLVRWSLTTDLQSTVSKLFTSYGHLTKPFKYVGWSSKEALLP